MTLLALDGIRKRFGGLHVLDGVDLQVRAGERHAIIGPNGAGKSTVFNLISGRLRPTSGRILLDGRDIAGESPHRVTRLGVGRSFQIINLFPRLTVAQNLEGAVLSREGMRMTLAGYGRRMAGVSAEVARMATLVGLQQRMDRPAAELPYGEQRKLEIALTIALDPRLVLLDEPCAGLNADDTHAAVDLIRRLTEGRTLLMVEHDMDVVFGLADRISVLHYGKVLATGTPAQIRANEQVQQAYLGRKANAARA